MLHKSNSPTSTKPPTQFNISKCSSNNPNSLQLAGGGQLTFWPPSAAVVDSLVLKLKAKHGDMEANWEKTILNFKKELDAESSAVDNNNSNNNGCGGEGIERREKARAKFSVPLSRREMEKDFEDMGERRLPRKPKKRPKIVQNQLDTLFPGLWLTEIHADLYRVSETKKSMTGEWRARAPKILLQFIGAVSTSCPSSDSFTMGGIYGQTQVNFLAINRHRVAILVNSLTFLDLVYGLFVILKLTRF